ncbi:hypothetical protein Purlil1_8059 [Purpureocillium lilacinum]|uniref:Uncharacterized protein n=1 Tax=Purpureocillium lilacinum TaxID=33203 RepID=A0ABR0BTW8_PURLI|nr:hypothetical protein Purlil1_8059 [Purpureocillium lilacinum]
MAKVSDALAGPWHLQLEELPDSTTTDRHPRVNARRPIRAVVSARRALPREGAGPVYKQVLTLPSFVILRRWPTEVGSWPPFSTYVDAPSRRDATILRDRPGSNPLLLLNKIIVALGGTSTQRHRSSLAVSSPTLPTGRSTQPLREPRRRARGSCPRKRAPFNDSIVNPQPGRFTAAGPGEGRRGTTDPRRMRRARQGSNAHRGACLVEPQLAQGPPPVPVPGTSRRRVVSFSLGWHTVTVTARHQALVAHTPLGYIGMYILSALQFLRVHAHVREVEHEYRYTYEAQYRRADGWMYALVNAREALPLMPPPSSLSTPTEGVWNLSLPSLVKRVAGPSGAATAAAAAALFHLPTR